MIDLDELQRLHEAATPEPWWWMEGFDNYLRSLVGSTGAVVCNFGCCEPYYPTQGSEPNDEDAAIIVAARNSLPALLRLARRARRLEKAAREAEAILRHQPVPGLSCAASREEPDKLDSDGSCPGCTCELQMALAALRAALAEGEGE